jgi:2-iminobutanoate/2-iminopropanoate deaminase
MDTKTLHTRRSYYVAGLDRKSPAPLASRIGNLVMSGGIYPRDPATKLIHESIEEQVVRIFKNIDLVIREAGGTVEDIIKVDFGVSDMAFRPLINDEWVRMFPDETSRPVRHVVPESHLPAPALVRCEIVAVLR